MLSCEADNVAKMKIIKHLPTHELELSGEEPENLHEDELDQNGSASAGIESDAALLAIENLQMPSSLYSCKDLPDDCLEQIFKALPEQERCDLRKLLSWLVLWGSLTLILYKDLQQTSILQSTLLQLVIFVRC